MTSLKKLDSYGVKFDDKLKELQELQAKVISNPAEFKLEHTDGTFKIVLDNIDLRITTPESQPLIDKTKTFIGLTILLLKTVSHLEAGRGSR